jgi:hypothetical protein
MDWVDGPTLGAFVADHYADAVTMQQLRASLRVLARQLAALGIAHGDIQPGNIVVRGATDVSLIDYDGMFVPELATLGSIELGQRNFQHPGRRWRHYHARLDGFSFAVMDVALGALAYRPELWNDARCDESAVFRAEDFIEPYASAALAGSAKLPPEVAQLCRDLPVAVRRDAGNRGLPRSRDPRAACARVVAALPHAPSTLPARTVTMPRISPRLALMSAIVPNSSGASGARGCGVTLADGGWIRIEFGAFPTTWRFCMTRPPPPPAAIDGLRQGEWIMPSASSSSARRADRGPHLQGRHAPDRPSLAGDEAVSLGSETPPGRQCARCLAGRRSCSGARRHRPGVSRARRADTHHP